MLAQRASAPIRPYSRVIGRWLTAVVRTGNLPEGSRLDRRAVIVQRRTVGCSGERLLPQRGESCLGDLHVHLKASAADADPAHDDIAV